MATVDPGDATNAIYAGNSLAEHGDIFWRTGVISTIAGIISGVFAFISESRRYHVPFGWKMVTFALSRVSSGIIAAYLALLAVPIFGIGTSARSEQLIAACAAMMGADFIGMIMRRVLGDRRQDSGPWDGKDRRGGK